MFVFQPAVVSVGAIQGGVRWNIIPAAVEMTGTIRTFDRAVREDALERIRLTAEQTADSAGAKATVTIESSTPVTYNDAELVRKMFPSLHRAAGENNTLESCRITGREDLAFFQEKTPGPYFFWVSTKKALGLGKRGQGSKLLEPRAALCFGTLWQGQGKEAEARQLVVGVYEWFSEGFDTSDLQQASALLEQAV